MLFDNYMVVAINYDGVQDVDFRSFQLGRE